MGDEALLRYASVVAGVCRARAPAARRGRRDRPPGRGRRSRARAAATASRRASATPFARARGRARGRRQHRPRRRRAGAGRAPAARGADGGAHAAHARGGHGDRLHLGRGGRPRERAVGLRPRLPRVRQADPHHGVGGARPGRHHQRRARGEAVGEHLRQGRADHRRLPAPPVRRSRPADADREPRLRAVLRGRRRRLRVDRRGGRAAVGAVRPAGRRRPRDHRLDQPARRRAAGRRRRPQDHRVPRALRGARPGRHAGRSCCRTRTCST